jgi:signal recognition particle receptor subunit beta
MNCQKIKIILQGRVARGASSLLATQGRRARKQTAGAEESGQIKGRFIRNYTVVPKYCRTTIFESGRLFFRIIRTP